MKVGGRVGVGNGDGIGVCIDSDVLAGIGFVLGSADANAIFVFVVVTAADIGADLGVDNDDGSDDAGNGNDTTADAIGDFAGHALASKQFNCTAFVVTGTEHVVSNVDATAISVLASLSFAFLSVDTVDTPFLSSIGDSWRASCAVTVP